MSGVSGVSETAADIELDVQLPDGGRRFAARPGVSSSASPVTLTPPKPKPPAR